MGGLVHSHVERLGLGFRVVAWAICQGHGWGWRSGTLSHKLVAAVQVAIARKANDYLQSGAAAGSNIRTHATAMDTWLGNLERQLSATIPKQMRADVPDADLMYRWEEGGHLQGGGGGGDGGVVGWWAGRWGGRWGGQVGGGPGGGQMGWQVCVWGGQVGRPVGGWRAGGGCQCVTPPPHHPRWVHNMVDSTIEAVDINMASFGRMTAATAWRVQRALLAAMVTGSYIPPCRLYLLKSATHPMFNVRLGCTDKDCLRSSTCKGNQFLVGDRVEGEGEDEEEGEPEVWHWGYEGKDVRIVIVHSKNDRKPSFRPIEFTLPRGPLTMLWLAHITEGHALLTSSCGFKQPCLFVNQQGKPFGDASFCHFWRSLMSATDTMGQAYFAPTVARTAFVDNYCSEYGTEPELWEDAAEGCAAVMDTSLRQWKETYNPSRRGRQARRAVAGHGAYVERRMAGV